MMQSVSKITIHSMGSARMGYGDFLKTINAKVRCLPFVKCRDDFGAADEPLALWPDMMTIGAFTQFDRLPFDLGDFVKRANLNPKIKAWEVLNEEDSPETYDAKANLYISLAPYFKSRNWTMVLFNCGSGNPPYYHEDGGKSYSAIARACKYFKDNGYKAILGVHEYWNGGTGTIGRYKALADYLADANALIPIAVTEFGFETWPGSSDKFMTMIEAADPVYIGDDRVMGCAAWTLGGGAWQGSNFERALPALGQYIATVQPVTPPPPPVTTYNFSASTTDPAAAVDIRAVCEPLHAEGKIEYKEWQS